MNHDKSGSNCSQSQMVHTRTHIRTEGRVTFERILPRMFPRLQTEELLLGRGSNLEFS